MFSKWIDAGRSVSAAVGGSIGAAFAFFAVIAKAAAPGNTSADTSAGGEAESSFGPALMAQIPPSDAENPSAGNTPLGGSGLFDDTLSADDVSSQVAQDSSIMTDGVDGNGMAIPNGGSTQITLASGAIVTVDWQGFFSYDPDGQLESLRNNEILNEFFTYTISDGDLTDTATVQVRVIGDNDPIVAINDAFSVDENAVLI